MDFNTVKFLGHPPESVLCTRDNMGRLHHFQVDLGYLRQVDFWTSNSWSAISWNKCSFTGPLFNISTSTCSNLLESLPMLLWTLEIGGAKKQFFVGIGLGPMQLPIHPTLYWFSTIFAILLWALFCLRCFRLN